MKTYFVYFNRTQLRGEKEAKQRWYFRPSDWETTGMKDSDIIGPFYSEEEAYGAIPESATTVDINTRFHPIAEIHAKGGKPLAIFKDPRDKFLWWVLADFGDEIVSWCFNAQNGGFGDGHYTKGGTRQKNEHAAAKDFVERITRCVK